MQDLLFLPRLRLAGGRTMAELATYGNVALWWFVHAEYEDAARKAVRGDPTGGGFPDTTGWLHRFDRGALLFASHAATEFLGALACRLAPRKPPPRSAIKILATSQSIQWREAAAPAARARSKVDVFFEPVFRGLGRRGSFGIVTTYPMDGGPEPWYRPLRGWGIAAERAREPGTPAHRPLELYWSPSDIMVALTARRHFSKIWRQISNDPVFRETFAPLGAAAETLSRRIHYFFVTVFPREIVTLARVRRLLDAEAPDLVLMLNEYGRFERGLLLTARLRGLPVLALQHGVIHPAHPGYILPAGSVSASGSVTAPFSPIPDCTAVYGEYHRRLLVEAGGYPESAVVVTGQPRYDRLATDAANFDRARILLDLRLDPAKKTVLWTTQTHWLPEAETRRSIAAVFAMARLLGVNLIVKLHPGEDQSAQLYREDSSLAPAIADGRWDTFALLRACDILLVKDSTTGLEGIGLGKPVVVMSLGPDPAVVDYVEKGVARLVARAEDLAPTVRELLEDDSELAAARPGYVREYLFALDGRAAERVVDLIARLSAAKPRAPSVRPTRSPSNAGESEERPK